MKYRESLKIALILLPMLSCSDDSFIDGFGKSSTGSLESEDVAVDFLETPTTVESITVPIQANAEIQKVESTSSEIQTVDSASGEIKPGPVFADCADEPNRPIVAELYQLPVDTLKLPDYAQLKPIKKICLSALEIKPRRFTEGFPGVANLFEWFSLDMRFAVNVPQAGNWSFMLVADDGANLYIANQKIIDNDGLHAPIGITGSALLKAGMVDFRVSYFQGPRYDMAVELLWKGPNDTEFSYIPKANLRKPLP